MTTRRLRSIGLGLILSSIVVTALPAAVSAEVLPTPTSVTITQSGPWVSGSQMTLTPVFTPAFPDGYQFPATAVCDFELLWGNLTTPFQYVYDETFGSVLLRGKGDGGFCGPWTFTVPYSAPGLWEFTFGYSGGVYGVYVPYTFVHGTNGVPAGSGITESNLPGVWLSMPHGTRQGDLVTATAHPFGGYTVPPNGAHWDAYSGCNCAQAFASADGFALTFTFRAKVPGTIAVFYNDSGTPEYGGPNFAGAGVDPKVIAVKVAPSMATTIHRSHWYYAAATSKGLIGTLRYSWYVDGVRVHVGRTVNLRFSRLGWHTVKVIVTDTHGHKATKTLWRYVRP